MNDTTDARIRFHAGRGMERHLLERIYGTFAVARVLGTPETAGISARRKTLGERLKAAREALGHTHNAVATILGGARADDIDSTATSTGPKRSRRRTDAALAEAVAMWRRGMTVAEMSRATGVPAMIYHRAVPRIREKAGAA